MSRLPHSAMVMSISLRMMLERQCHALLAHGAEAIEERPADIGAARTERHGFQHILTGADAAIQMHLDAVGDSIDDPRQHADRGGGAIELAAAVVGHDDGVGPGIDGLFRILDIEDALDDQRAAPLFLDPGDILPRQLRIELFMRESRDRWRGR